jgi:hypothetical protein
MKEHRACYGRLFPSAGFRESPQEPFGAPFGYVFEQRGVIPRPPEIVMDLEAWDRCVECPEFASCQQLSASKLLLEVRLVAGALRQDREAEEDRRRSFARAWPARN